MVVVSAGERSVLCIQYDVRMWLVVRVFSDAEILGLVLADGLWYNLPR